MGNEHKCFVLLNAKLKNDYSSSDNKIVFAGSRATPIRTAKNLEFEMNKPKQS